MKIRTIGLDVANNVFQVHGVDERRAAVLLKQLKREQVAPFFVRHEPCLLGIQLCGGTHYWATKLSTLCHRVKMMAPQFVKPYGTNCVRPARHGRLTSDPPEPLRRRTAAYVHRMSGQRFAIVPIEPEDDREL